MNVYRNGLTRRDFLWGAAGVTWAGAVASAQRPASPAPARGRAKVVLVRDPNAVDAQGNANAEVVQRMLDDAVAALLGESDPAAAWHRLVKPDDVVGIKTNQWSFLRTPPEIEEAIQRRVGAAGVSADRLGMDDRGVLGSPIFRKATALINVRPMRTHHWAGVGSCINNYILFAQEPSRWHEDACANVAGVWDLPLCKGKTRLNILVMLTPLFHGKGPHNFNKDYVWPYSGILVGADPVAVDATGLRIIEAKRRAHFGRDVAFDVPPRHIRIAQDKFHLGIADTDHIDMEKRGWTKDILI